MYARAYTFVRASVSFLTILLKTVSDFRLHSAILYARILKNSLENPILMIKTPKKVRNRIRFVLYRKKFMVIEFTVLEIFKVSDVCARIQKCMRSRTFLTKCFKTG